MECVNLSFSLSYLQTRRLETVHKARCEVGEPSEIHLMQEV